MRPVPKFSQQPKDFWAHVRSISQRLGYTARKTKTQPATILAPKLPSILEALEQLGLNTNHVASNSDTPTHFGIHLVEYFQLRADTLNQKVHPLLMTKKQAAALYKKLAKDCKVKFVVSNNKQKGEKSGVNYLTGIVNILLCQALDGMACDYSPRQLTTFTRQGSPVRTLSRWVDGAFTSAVNPVAIWEIKEYYNTKTFGSRVADGVYESLLDGMELEELRIVENISCQHVLFVDDHFTWWDCGRSYLCRLFDMLHMGYVDEVVFGREAVERVPIIAREWIALDAARRAAS